MSGYDENEDEIERQIKNVVLHLKEEREKARISQMDLSLDSGLAQNQINYIETGKRTPNLHTILKICKALNINPAVLFSPPDEERRKTKELIVNLLAKL
jgi:transcriptional regulator with XRE-family HTH domain